MPESFVSQVRDLDGSRGWQRAFKDYLGSCLIFRYDSKLYYSLWVRDTYKETGRREFWRMMVSEQKTFLNEVIWIEISFKVTGD